jgi:2-oxoglutarate ferredoxin oxidoreductase subunit beta
MIQPLDYKSIAPAWCPGCGDFAILNALKKALVALDLAPHAVTLCSGIGQAAKLPHYLKCNVFNGLHGRGLPAATGAKIANHQQTVIAVGGDGDMYGEGGNHFLHALRRNLNMTLLVHDNKIYGLTKGQASPTTDRGVKTKVQPNGVVNQPLNPLALAISQHASFVARAYSGQGEFLVALLQKAILHQGFALVDILQPCVSFNKVNTREWYEARIYKLEDDPQFDPRDWHAAMAKTQEWGERIPTGIFFIADRPTYEEQQPQLARGPLYQQRPSLEEVSRAMANF